jgi:hypothetical protein
VFHVTSRGDRREPIYRDDGDRAAHLDIIARAMDRFDAQVLAYCLMGYLPSILLSTLDAPGQLQVEEALLGILDRSPEVYNWDEFTTTRLLGLASEEHEVLKSWILSKSGLPHVQNEDRLTRAYETAELLARETAKVRGLLRPT